MMLEAQIQPADIQDRDGALPVLKEVRRLFPFIERIFADGGYQGARAKSRVFMQRNALNILYYYDLHKFMNSCCLFVEAFKQ